MKHSAFRFAAVALLAPLAVSIVTPSAGAALIVDFNFAGATGDQASTNGISAVGLGTSTVSRGPGVTASLAGNSISASNWTTTSFDTNDYFEFNVVAVAGYVFTVDTIAFNERRSGTGIAAMSLRSSQDGYSANLFSATVPDDTASRNQLTADLGASFEGLTTVTFRLFGHNAEASGGTWRLNDLDINGSVALLPEPGSLALLGLGGLITARRRHDA